MAAAPQLFDQRAAGAKRARARRIAREGSDFAVRLCAEEIAGRLAATNRRFERCLDLFPSSPALSVAVAAACPGIEIVAVGDASLAGRDPVGESLGLEPGGCDLAVSAFGLHRLNDLPGALVQIRRALKPDGLFMAALPGEGTLRELRESLIAAELEATGGAAARVDPFADIRQAGALLQRAGFALPVADAASHLVRYASVAGLVADLRANGAGASFAERAPALPRAFAERLEAAYARRFADPDGRLRASLEIVYLTGWAPHESQQKPLKPGSAEIGLADFLKR